MRHDPNQDFKSILQHSDHRISFFGIDLLVLDGVFTPEKSISFTTALLAEQTNNLAGKTVLDMGCGTGALALYAAKQGASHVLAVDIDEHALTNTRMNVTNNERSDFIEVRKSNLFCNVQESFDIIFANLPINDYFWKSASDTLSVVERFLTDYPAHLNPGGCAYLAWGSMGDVDGIRERLKQKNLSYQEYSERTKPYTWYVFRLSYLDPIDRQPAAYSLAFSRILAHL